MARRSGSSSLALARFVEGFGKMLVMAVCRATLYKQFDRAAAGGHRLLRRLRLRDAARRPRCVNGVPRRVAVLAVDVLGLRAGRACRGWRWSGGTSAPTGRRKPVHVPIDWLAVTLFVAWVVAIVFAFGWYRKWGGWTSNAFAATVVLCVALPVVLVVWLGSGFSPDEHLKRLLRIAGLRPVHDDPRADAPAPGRPC